MTETPLLFLAVVMAVSDGKGRSGGLVQRDVRVGGDGMGPLNIQCFFETPNYRSPPPGRIGSRQACATGFVELGEGRSPGYVEMRKTEVIAEVIRAPLRAFG